MRHRMPVPSSESDEERHIGALMFRFSHTRVVKSRRVRWGIPIGVGIVACNLAGCTSSAPTDVATVPGSAAHAYPADLAAAVCGARLRPVFVSTPPIKQAGPGVNGYAAVSVSPSPLDTVALGSPVRVVLAVSVNAGGPWPSPPATSTLPNVVGMDVNTALGTLTADGVLVDVSTASPTGTMTVTTQVPAAGATVRAGSTVTLAVGTTDSDGCK